MLAPFSLPTSMWLYDWFVIQLDPFVSLPPWVFLNILVDFKDNLHVVKIHFVVLSPMASDKFLEWHVYFYCYLWHGYLSTKIPSCSPFVVNPYTHLHSNLWQSQIFFFLCSFTFSRMSHKYNFGKFLAIISSNISFFPLFYSSYSSLPWITSIGLFYIIQQILDSLFFTSSLPIFL